MRKYLREYFTHKDGIWITLFGHLNSDEFRITIWKADIIVA